MERFFQVLSEVVVKRRPVIIVIGLILIVASLFGAMHITMASGTETFLSTDSQAYKDYERFNEHFGSSAIVVMVTGDNIPQLLQADNLRAMEAVENQMGANPKVISAIGPVFMIKQAVAVQTGVAALPSDQQMLQAIVMDPQSGQIRAEFRNVFPDDKHALIPVVLQGLYFSGEEAKDVVRETERVVSTAGFVGVQPAITGPPAFMTQMEDMMTKDMGVMFIVSIFLMLLILGLIFSVRGFFAWRWLPLGAVGLGIIYTFGVVGLLSIPVTMVSMSAFPILVGLGVDYSINLHNRYDEETRKGGTLADAVKASLIHVGPSIGIAVVALCLSFTAMFFSAVPMIRDFGRMLIIGVIACYVVALLFPLAVVYWRDRRADQRAPSAKPKDKPGEEVGITEKVIQRIAPWVIRNPAIIIPIAVAVTVAGFVSDSHIKTETDETKFISDKVVAMKNYQTLKDIMSGAVTLNVLVEAKDVTAPETLSWMVQFEDRIGNGLKNDVCNTNSVTDLVLQTNGGYIPQDSGYIKQCLNVVPLPIKRNLVSDDYTAANIVVGLSRTEQKEVDQLRDVRAKLSDYASDVPDGVSVTVTGAASLGPDYLAAFTSGRVKMTLIGIGLVFLGLFLLFRLNPLKALLTGLPIVLVIGWASGLMYVSGMKYTPLTACLGTLIMGMGVEYTVLYMMRYYEERGKGEVPATAMTTAMTKVGRAIMASGATTICGFAALLAATDFLILRDFGIMTVIAVFLALVSALVVHPPMVVLVDSWLEKRRLAKVRETSESVASE